MDGLHIFSNELCDSISSSSTTPLSLAEMGGHVYVITGHKGVLSNSLQIHKLDAEHGIVQDESKISASPKDLNQVKVVDGHIVWVEKNHIKVNSLGSSDVSSVAIDVSFYCIRLISRIICLTYWLIWAHCY
jgi:hypothetical protein